MHKIICFIFLFFCASDFGVDELIEFKNQTGFPWLLSNVVDNICEELLAEGIDKIMIEWQGKKVSGDFQGKSEGKDAKFAK